jgi:hypothetical protein
VPPAALIVQIVALWVAGRGLTFLSTSGGIVSFLYWITIIVVAVLVVLIPAATAWLHRAIVAVEEADRPRRSESGGGDA